MEHPFSWKWENGRAEHPVTGASVTGVTPLAPGLFRENAGAELTYSTAADDPRPTPAPGVRRRGLLMSTVLLVSQLNVLALLLSVLWAVPALLRLGTLRVCLRIRDDKLVFRQTDRLYRLASGPTMSWMITGLFAGLSIASVLLVWAGVLGSRRTGGIAVRWAPVLVFTHGLLYVANYEIMYRWLRQKYVLLEGQVNIISFLMFPLVTYLGSRAVERRVAAGSGIARRTVAAYLGLLAIAFGYFWIIPRLWFARSMTDGGRIAIRLVLHPLFFETANFFVRAHVRGTDLAANPSRVVYLVLPGTVLAGLYGRFLVATSSSTAITLGLAAALSVIEVTLRLSVGARDRWAYKAAAWIRGKNKSKGDDHRAASTTDDLFSSTVSRRLRADIVALEQMVENASIITTSMMVYVFDMSNDGVRIPLSRAVLDAGIQLLLEFFTDCFVTYIEERHAGVPIFRAWRTRHDGRWATHFAFVALLSTTFAAYFIFVFVNPTSGWTAFRQIDQSGR